MTKQEMMDQVNQMTVSQTIKDRLVARINFYPDQLADEHINDFEDLIMELAMTEDAAASSLSKAANHMQAGLDKEEVDFAAQMEDIASDAEATNQQLRSLT